MTNSLDVCRFRSEAAISSVRWTRIYRVRSYQYIGSPLNDRGVADDGIRNNIMEAKRQLAMSRPVLRLKVLSIKTQAKLFETVIKLDLLYSLSIFSFARWMITNKIKVTLRNLAVQIEKRRLYLWVSLYKRRYNCHCYWSPSNFGKTQSFSCTELV